MKKQIAYILILLHILWSVDAFADTHNAATCGQDDIMTAIGAAVNGDVVSVPSGSCTWTNREGSGLKARAPVSIDDKNITLQGAGIGSTIITVNTGNTWEDCTLYVNDANQAFRITGFTFTSSLATTYQVIYVTKETNQATPTTGWRIDHNRFDFSGDRKAANPIEIYQPNYGLIDNNQFNSSDGGYQAILIEPYLTSGETNLGETMWADAPGEGTANAVYIEDNTVTHNQVTTALVDSNCGARVVTRYNSITNAIIYSHGPGQGGNCRGMQWMEVYNNTLTTSLSMYSPITYRSGSGVVFNNTVSTSGAGAWSANGFVLDVPRAGCGAGVTCKTSGIYVTRCDGTQAAVDGNEESAAGYPCMDQPGVGYGALTSQTKSPLYEWENGSYHFTVANNETSDPHSSDHIQANRDYYNSTAKTGYTAYAYPHPLQNAGETLYTVTPSVASGSGAVSPIVPASVISGENSPTYTATPANGWKVTWSGTCGATGSAATYQKTNVTADCTVIATFTEIQLMPW